VDGVPFVSKTLTKISRCKWMSSRMIKEGKASATTAVRISKPNLRGLMKEEIDFARILVFESQETPEPKAR
jgi:hypothetical protein